MENKNNPAHADPNSRQASSESNSLHTSPNFPRTKAQMITWVSKSLLKPPFPCSPQQSLLNNKHPKQPAYYDGRYYKSLLWKEYQNWHSLDPSLRAQLIRVWHKDSLIEGLSTLGGWNGEHWLCWADLDLQHFESNDKLQLEIDNWTLRYDKLRLAPQFKTPSGGYRVLVAFEKEPENFGANNGFTFVESSDQKVGELLTKNGGHSLLPPCVGTNGKAYEWVVWANYPPVFSSPSEIGLYPLTSSSSSTAKQKTSTPQSQKTSKTDTTFSSTEKTVHINNGNARQDLTQANVPLYQCLTLDDRALLDAGTGNGDRNIAGAKLARNLIGTASRLDYLGIGYTDDPYQLFLDYCHRCSSGGGWDLREWDLIWQKALKDNPTASLTDDALIKCVKAWLKKQRLPSRARSAQTSEKVISHPNFTPLSDEDFSAKVDELINLDLPPSKLTAKLNELAKLARIPIQEVRKLYFERLGEIELTESRGEIHAELEQLREATKSRISLSSVVPIQIAHPIEKLANWLNLRPECYLTALLAGLCILNDTETLLVLNRDWGFTVTPNLFAAIVSPSSQKKSPIIKAMVTEPLRALQRKAKKEYSQALEKYEKDLARYEELKRNKDKETLESEFPNGRPVEPRMKLYYFTNATGEGIINQVAAHPGQGLLYLKDELAGVFKSANQYRGGRGSDEEDLLSYYDGTGGTVLRANGTQADLDGLLLGILGSIQPGVLQKLLGDFEDSNGKWARFMFVWQPLASSQMNADGGKFDISSLIAWLYEEMDRTSALAPKQYALTPDAFKLFCTAYNGLEKLRVDPSSSPAMQNVWGKCEGRIGKIAIELHRIEAVFAGELPSPLINRSTIKAAIALTYFSAQQVQALYAMLGGENSLPPMLAKVLDIAERKGDWITAGDVQLNFTCKKRPRPETVRQWFKELAKLNLGTIQGEGRKLKFSLSNKTGEQIG